MKRLMKSYQLRTNLLLVVVLAAAHPLLSESVRIFPSEPWYQWNVVNDRPPYWDLLENIPPYWD